jgi:hypothetical protein
LRVFDLCLLVCDRGACHGDVLLRLANKVDQ